MNDLKTMKVKFVADTDGATAIEYGLIAGGSRRRYYACSVVARGNGAERVI